MDGFHSHISDIVAAEQEKKHICSMCRKRNGCELKQEFFKDFKRRHCPEFEYRVRKVGSSHI